MTRFKMTFSIALTLILSLAMAATVAAAPGSPGGSNPSELTAELCGDSVCLSWKRGDLDYTSQRVLFWQGDLSLRHFGGFMAAGRHSTEARVPLDALDIEPTVNPGDTAAYHFQIVAYATAYNSGVSSTTDYSNWVTLDVPRPAAGPSELVAELCGESICFSWTPGAGDLTYQEIKYWETGNPGNLSARGSRIVLPDVSETRIQIIHMNRSGNHSGDASYTFQAVGITGEFGNFDYSGYSNEVDLQIPAHLMERPDNDDNKKRPANGNNKKGKK